MKKEELTETQEYTYNKILELCAVLGQEHWFRREEIKYTYDPTLSSLRDKGFLISKFVESNENEYWQYTGKIYEKPDRCHGCRSLITSSNKMLEDGSCMSCEKKYEQYMKRERARRGF